MVASSLLLLPATLLVLASASRSSTCVHSSFVAATLGQTVTEPPANSTSPLRRGLQIGASHPLVVTPLFQYDYMPLTSTFTAAKRDWLVGKLVPAAIRDWSTLLSAPGASPPTVLQAHRSCAYVWTGTATLQCSSYEASTLCAAGFDPISLPLDGYMGEDTVYPSKDSAQTLPATGGVPGTDYAMFVTAQDTSICTRSGGGDVLAYAQSCQRDASDRPTFGRINFCPAALDTSPDDWHFQLSVAMHEMAHALGFTDSSFPLFRAPDGTPRTPRWDYDPTQPALRFQVAYTCGGYNYVYPSADPATIAFFPERGTPCVSGATPSASFLPYVDGATHKADCVARSTSPAMAAAARAYHGCASLPGPEMDHLDGDCALYGSHWGGRALMQELMAPYVSHWPLLGPLTLAFFDDSGWYKANYAGSAGAALRPGDWGFQRGCSFARDKCSAGNAGSPPAWFMGGASLGTNTNDAVCTTDGRAIGYSETNSYSSVPLPYQVRALAAPALPFPPTPRPYPPHARALAVLYGPQQGRPQRLRLLPRGAGLRGRAVQPDHGLPAHRVRRDAGAHLAVLPLHAQRD